MTIGSLSKLKSTHDNIVQYQLPVGDSLIDLNPYIGTHIKLEHTGSIFCVDTGKKIKKAYGQGYSWESFITLPECDTCIIKPELCHYKAGTCRDPKWGESHCLKPHVIYLSLTSNLKVGITRKTQVPTRWVDQGAVKAIKLLEVKDRLTSGKIEIEIAKTMGDKTNWRNMLKNVYEDMDLLAKKKEVIKQFADIIKKHEATVLDDELYEFNYPVEKYPEKVSSFNFDKNPIVEGVLMGIKGQYLIFDTGVINIRKFQGYEINFES